MRKFSLVYVFFFLFVVIAQFILHVTTIGVDYDALWVLALNMVGAGILISLYRGRPHVPTWAGILFSLLFLILTFSGTGAILLDKPSVFIGMVVIYGMLPVFICYYVLRRRVTP